MDDSMGWSELFAAWTEGMDILGVAVTAMPHAAPGQVAGWAPRRQHAIFPAWLRPDDALEAARMLHRPERLAATLIGAAAGLVDAPHGETIAEMAAMRTTRDERLVTTRIAGDGLENALATIAFENAAFLRDWGPVERQARRRDRDDDILLDPEVGAAHRREHPLTPPMAWLRGRTWGRAITSLARGEIGRIEHVEVIDSMIDDVDSSPVEAIVSFHTLEAFRQRRGRDFRIGTAAAPSPETLATLMKRRSEEMEIAEELLDWIESGSQIFQIGRDLHRELALTDVDDVCVDELEMPYDAIYIGFEDMAAADGEQIVDGFMVSVEKGLKRMFITPMSRDVPDLEAMGVLGRRIEIDLDSRSEDLVVDLIEDDADDWDRLSRDYLKSYERHKDDKERVFGSAENYDATIEVVREMVEATRRNTEMMRREKARWASLVVNALLYIGNCGGGERGYAGEAPADLVDRISRNAPGARKAEQRLRAEGHIPVTRLDLPRSERGLGGNAGDHGPKRAHWRRGHWRRQGCGPGRATVRRVRVRPTLVGGHHGADTERTYRLDRRPPRNGTGERHTD